MADPDSFGKPVGLAARRADLANAYYRVGRPGGAVTLPRETVARCERPNRLFD
jgi:hypothetical protein